MEDEDLVLKNAYEQYLHVPKENLELWELAVINYIPNSLENDDLDNRRHATFEEFVKELNNSPRFALRWA